MEICKECWIVYDERHCPLCTAKDEIKRLERENEKLEDELKELL